MPRPVVVARAPVSSARLLLNSKSTLFPDGIANSSGTVGRYLMDSVAAAAPDTSADAEHSTAQS